MGDATQSQNGTCSSGWYRCDCGASRSWSVEGAERLWEVQAWGADVKHTVTEGRQSERQGYCQSLTAAHTHTHSICHGGMERTKEGENYFVALMRLSLSFKTRPLSVETSAHWIKSNQAVIKDLASVGKEFLEVSGKGGHIPETFPGGAM